MDLVTGGCGFIGRHLVLALLAAGRRVRVFDLRPWRSEDGPEAVQGSITDMDAVLKAMGGCERVFHLAANPNLWARDPAEFDRVNHRGTLNVLAAARQAKPGRLVYTSTESILKSCRQPPSRSQAMIDESVRLELDDMPGPYCRSKFLAEVAARKAAGDGVPVVIVNPTMPLGPGDDLVTPPTRMLVNFLTGATPAYLDCEFNVVDARDAALGHILAAERGRVGERYILGGANVRLGALLAELSGQTGIPMPQRRVPYPVALAAAYVGEGLARLTGKPPMAPLTGVRLARTSLAFDCSKARSELDWRPRPLNETLADTLAWLESSGRISLPARARSN